MTAVEGAKEMVESGSLPAAIERVTPAVKGNPADGRVRAVRELRGFAGEWDRAENRRFL
jgi:protein involved in temperature-dependent protein secretion